VTRAELETALATHIPQHAVEACANMIINHKVSLRVTKSRVSKYGDYQAPHGGKGHRISINHNLNPYMFLVTFVHEMAHLTTFNKFSHRAEPHGRQWKSEFKLLLGPFIRSGIFPADVKAALENYMLNPAATSCSDPELFKALKNHNIKDHFDLLEHLPEGCEFRMKGYSEVFIKGKLLRKSFSCIMKGTKRTFRIPGIAEVQQVTLF